MAYKDVGELSGFKIELKKHFPMKDFPEVTKYSRLEAGESKKCQDNSL